MNASRFGAGVNAALERGVDGKYRKKYCSGDLDHTASCTFFSLISLEAAETAKSLFGEKTPAVRRSSIPYNLIKLILD